LPTIVTSASLPEYYAAESARIRERFEFAGEGGAAVEARAALVDNVASELFHKLIGSGPEPSQGVSLVALGGYGRRQLFPYSDVDLLLLAKSQRVLDARREPFAALTRTLWDLGLRIGSTARTLEECGKLDRDNLEFSISLLDSRHMVGDSELSARLHDDIIPRLVRRELGDLAADLLKVTAQRHEKFGNTIFHLEPNVKEAPGGLRDYHVARWLGLIQELGLRKRWASPEALWPAPLGSEAIEGARFLADLRTFIHYERGRDDNQLSYELQEHAARRGVGAPGSGLPPAEWMRIYFQRARSVNRLARRLLEDRAPSPKRLFGLYRDSKSRLSTPEFTVGGGKIYPRQPELLGLDALLAAFELVAQHGLELGGETDRWVEQAVAKMASGQPPHWEAVWKQFRRILAAPGAALALRAMHRLGLLNRIFPEFRVVDALVLRDFYHRYTVDEHSLRTIENLGMLRSRRRKRPRQAAPLSPPGGDATGWEAQFEEILSELEQPELLVLSLLFHDVGKGMTSTDHIEGSLAAVAEVFERFDLPAEERETVRFLISKHLEMSRTVQRRDIFDPETVREFAQKVGTPERLKMLTLLTYTDIKSVNPEALTPWKAEMLWQLYTAASNYLSRSLDEERFTGAGDSAEQAGIVAALPAESRREFAAFLEGFPRRYCRSHSSDVITRHFHMEQGLRNEPAQIGLENQERFWELTVVTRDRPFLFASLTGTLAAWGLNILKADAFGNARGSVLDIFRFVDAHRTLELNPSELERFKRNLTDVLAGRESVERLMRGRTAPRPGRTKVGIPTQVRYEVPPSLEGAARTTLLELITFDRPGLLYQVSSAIAELRLNIEVALIDTEGEKVIDVFYLTEKGAPLVAATERALRDSLLRNLNPAG
jgi:[protein-PII] uridylyltransferase